MKREATALLTPDVVAQLQDAFGSNPTKNAARMQQQPSSSSAAASAAVTKTIITGPRSQNLEIAMRRLPPEKCAPGVLANAIAFADEEILDADTLDVLTR